MSAPGTFTSALTFLPRTDMKEWVVAFLSPDMFASTNQYRGRTGLRSTMSRQIASVAIVTMFWPEASPVMNSN